jgi:alkanesulfonate monooxygenase SsuD/methylene tetrahydromethanopterin reductase-like flavin-dependent oxidoreductase (luciferase family)
VEVGILLIFQNYQGRASDTEMVRDQMRLAEHAEPLGFDAVWCVEHHFTDYSACPDNVAFLSWLAGRTRRVKLATGAVIVPWWSQPLRVVERIVLLDHLSAGRAMLGLGRGLSRIEYRGFGIEMGESRARFDEASRMIVDALDKGFIEGDGPCYPQVRTEIRPRPLRGFRDRLYAVGLSPDSIEQAAALGARLMTFSQQPWELYAQGPLASYRTAWSGRQRGQAPLPVTGDLFFCHEDPTRAEAMAMEYMTNYFLSIVHHYELLSEHFRATPGYELYANASEAFRQVGLETAVRSYCSVQTWGTPAQILEKLRWRRELLGGFELNLIVHYGGMPVEESERSLRTFAEEVLPELHRW